MNRGVEVKTVYTHSWSSEGAKNDQTIQLDQGGLCETEGGTQVRAEGYLFIMQEGSHL